MQYGLYKKGIILAIICLFIGAGMLPSISSEILKSESIEKNFIENENTFYDWPMFRHDNNHTGYTKGVGEIKGPAEKWTKNANGNVMSSPAIGNIDDDRQLEVVVGSNDGNVYAINGSTGDDEKWRFSTKNQVLSSPAIGDIDNDGQVEVVVGSDDNKVYAINGTTGEEKWNFPTGRNVQSSPALGDIDNDGQIDIVVFGSFDRNVYALYGTNGTEKWRFPTGDCVDSSPAIGDIDNDGEVEVVVGSHDWNIYAIDGATGDEKWNYSTGGIVMSSPAIGNIDDDEYEQIEVVVGSHDRNVYAIDGATGNMKWNFTTGGEVMSSPAIGNIDDDRQLEVVVGSNDSCIYAIDGSTGDKEWAFEMGVPIIPTSSWSSPAIGDIDNDGQVEVVVGSNKGYIYAINGTTGNKTWEFNTEGGIFGAIFSSPAIGDIDNDGQVEVVVGSLDNNIYALDSDDILPNVEIKIPDKGYIYRLKGTITHGPFPILDDGAIVLGGIEVMAIVTDEGSGIDRDSVKFFVNDGSKTLMTSRIPNQYTGPWYGTYLYFIATLTVEAYDNAENHGIDQRIIWFACD